jgi:hypothetical protein
MKLKYTRGFFYNDCWSSVKASLSLQTRMKQKLPGSWDDNTALGNMEIFSHTYKDLKNITELKYVYNFCPKSNFNITWSYHIIYIIYYILTGSISYRLF